MNSSQIITIAASAVAVILPLIFSEGLKELIKKSFSDISPPQVRRYFAIGLIVYFVLISSTGFGITVATADEKDDMEHDEAAHQETVDPYENDTIQAAIDLVKTGIEKTEEYIDNKRTRDSIFFADRDQYWVYSIGNPKDDESAAWDAAMEVATIGNVSIFKEGRKSYYVICDPLLDQEDLQDSLSSYEDRLNSLGVNSRIELVNLVGYCSKKELLIETDPVKRKKHDETFDCLTCDK